MDDPALANLSEKMRERVLAWRKNPNPDFQKARQKLSEYQQQELELFEYEKENNGRHTKR